MVHEIKRSAHFRLAHTFRLVRYPLSRQPFFLVRKVRPQTPCCGNEQDRSREVEWLCTQNSSAISPQHVSRNVKPFSSYLIDWIRGSIGTSGHTPPLFRARTCSIVVSLHRGPELEKHLNCVCTPALPVPSCPLFVFLAAQLALGAAAIRDVGFEAWTEAKVRRADVWTEGVLSALAAPATQADPGGISRGYRR